MCTKNSSYVSYAGKFERATKEFQIPLKKTSIFDYYWEVVYDLTDDIAKRYILYYPFEGFMRVYPGSKVPETYNP